MTVSDDLAVLIEAALAGAAANAGPSDVSTGDYASRVEQAAKGMEVKIARLREWGNRQADLLTECATENERLRDGLREIAEPRPNRGFAMTPQEKARALLAGGRPAPVESLLTDEDYEVLAEDGKTR